jgi:hypothetical protein
MVLMCLEYVSCANEYRQVNTHIGVNGTFFKAMLFFCHHHSHFSFTIVNNYYSLTH